MAPRTPQSAPVQLGQEINQISAALEQANNASLTQLPESVFVNNFLPMFAGESVPPHINPSQWAAIAGTPYREVQVIGADGQVLYHVPPLLDREGVDLTKAPGNAPRMSHVVATTNQMQLMSPRQADAYLRKQLHNRGILNNSPEFVQRNTRRWNEIFARYNKPLLGEDGTPEALEDFQPKKTDEKIELNYGDDIL